MEKYCNVGLMETKEKSELINSAIEKYQIEAKEAIKVIDEAKLEMLKQSIKNDLKNHQKLSLLINSLDDNSGIKKALQHYMKNIEKLL